MKENEKILLTDLLLLAESEGSTRVVAKLLKWDIIWEILMNIPMIILTFHLFGNQIGLNKIIKLITRVLLED